MVTPPGLEQDVPTCTPQGRAYNPTYEGTGSRRWRDRDHVVGRLAMQMGSSQNNKSQTDTFADIDRPNGAGRTGVSGLFSTHWGHRPHPVWWLIAGSLVVIAVAQIGRIGAGPAVDWGGTVLGQTTAGGARGMFAFSGQLTKSTYGVFMVDVDTMTIWTYEYLPQKSCLRLASARTWRYDRYLENHNVCDLPPEAVEEMIERQRAYRIDKADKRMPQD